MLRRTLAFSLATTFIIALALLDARTSAQRNAKERETRAASTRVPAPEDVLGFRPGDDRKLASWSSVVEYFKRLSAASDRVKFEELGKTTMGAPFVMATISAPENLQRLDEFKEIERQPAEPRPLVGKAERKRQPPNARGEKNNL